MIYWHNVSVDPRSMFHAEPRGLVDVRVAVGLVVRDLDVVPLRVVEALRHGRGRICHGGGGAGEISGLLRERSHSSRSRTN